MLSKFHDNPTDKGRRQKTRDRWVEIIKINQSLKRPGPVIKRFKALFFELVTTGCCNGSMWGGIFDQSMGSVSISIMKNLVVSDLYR